MKSTSQLRRNYKSKLASKQDVTNAIPALMGNGHGVIEVPNQPGYVYIRIGNGDLGQAFNSRCPLADNLAVYVGYDPVLDPDRRIFQVLSVRMADYAAGGNAPVANVGPHHVTHEFGGGDDVYVNWRRLMGLRVGRPSAFNVTVDQGVILRAGAWLETVAQTLNLAAMKPGVSTQSRYVLISLNAAGTAIATAGALVTGALDISNCPIPGAGEIPLAAVRLYGTQTAIGDTPIAPDIVDLRFPQANPTATHNILSAAHGDALVAAVVDGDIIIGNATPKWSRLAISIPAANVRNVLGIDNGELRPSWKTALDATVPTTIAESAAAAAGTSLVFSHRDHTHGAPATWTATAHNILSAIHGDTAAAALVQGDILYVNAAGKLTRLAAPVSPLYPVLQYDTNAPNNYPVWGGTSFTGTVGGGMNFAVTSGKVLTLTATNNYNLTIPDTGTVALLGIANAFTESNTIASGKFLTCLTDGNTGGLRAGAGSDVLWYRGAADAWRTPDKVLVDGFFGTGTTNPLAQFVASNGGAEGFEIDPAGLDQNVYFTGYDRVGLAYIKLTLRASAYSFCISTAEKASIDASGNMVLSGTIKTTLGSAWDLGAYTAGAPAATGYVTIKIGGTTYKLLAST